MDTKSKKKAAFYHKRFSTFLLFFQQKLMGWTTAAGDVFFLQKSIMFTFRYQDYISLLFSGVSFIIDRNLYATLY